MNEAELLQAAQDAWNSYVAEVSLYRPNQISAALTSVRRLMITDGALNMLCAHAFTCDILNADQPYLEKVLQSTLNQPDVRLLITVLPKG